MTPTERDRIDDVERDRRRREREILALLLILCGDAESAALMAVTRQLDPAAAAAAILLAGTGRPGTDMGAQLAERMGNSFWSAVSRVQRWGGLKHPGPNGQKLVAVAGEYTRLARRSAQKLADRIARAITEKLAGPSEFDRPERVRLAFADVHATDSDHSRLSNIADQATLKTYSDGMFAAYWMPETARLIGAFRHRSILDNVTTVICFPGSTRVRSIGGIRRVFRRHYKGEMLIVRTSTGDQIEVTPNHPILTARGWLAAKKIDPRNEIIYSVRDGGCCVICAPHIGMPPTFAELADSAFEPSRSDIRIQRATATDFHGDGQGGNSQIDIASPHGHLMGNPITTLIQTGGNQLFDFLCDRIGVLLARYGRRFQHLLGRPLADVAAELSAALFEYGMNPALTFADSSSNFSRPGTGRMELERAGGIDLLGLSTATRHVWHHSNFLQRIRDAGGGDFVMPCQRCGRFSVPVTGGKIVEIRSRFADCHVYNLESRLGCYIADGILVKNCEERDGLTLVPSDPYWKTNWPSLHYGCRSVVLPVFKGENFELSTWRPTVPPMDGFGIAPPWVQSL